MEFAEWLQTGEMRRVRVENATIDFDSHGNVMVPANRVDTDSRRDDRILQRIHLRRKVTKERSYSSGYRFFPLRRNKEFL